MSDLQALLRYQILDERNSGEPAKHALMRAAADRIAELEKFERAVKDHNKSCQDRCSNAATCGYVQYFLANGRRCPNCPVHDSIEL